MISVLIPTYNYNVIPLVKSLLYQFKRQNFKFEIICFDNGSKSVANQFNDQMNNLDFCSFVSLKNNGGRSKIRNLLARNAKFDWLLFLDADVLPYSDKFIHNYITRIKENPKVVFGGLKYEDTKPSKDKLLRWVYGKKREEISIRTRIKNPNKHFTSANFLIHKSVFNEVLFDEELTEYGFEDTFFAIELIKKGIFIDQLDNPVYHLGLDFNKVFIDKTKKAIENLMYLKKQQKLSSGDNNLLKCFGGLRKMKLDILAVFLFKKFNKKMENNLDSKQPSLFIYDLFKLGYLFKIYKN